MIRVTVVHQMDPRVLRPGGVEGVIRDMIAFAPSRVAVDVVGVDARGDARLGTWTHVDVDGRGVRFLAAARLDPADIHRRVVPHSLRFATGLARFRSRIAAATVHTHRAELGVVASHLIRPHRLVQFIHGDTYAGVGAESDSMWRFAPAVFRRFESLVARRADAVVVFSRAGAARLARLHPDVSAAPAWFRPDVFRPGDGVAGGHRLVWVGRLESPKDPLLAVDALASVRRRCWPDATLTLLGDGSLRGLVVARARELGVADAVALAGAATPAGVADELRRHRILVATSHFEGPSPRVVVEALASGTPVVAVSQADPDGLVRAGATGMRVRSRHPDAIADAVPAAAGTPAHECARAVAHLRADRIVPALPWDPR